MQQKGGGSVVPFLTVVLPLAVVEGRDVLLTGYVLQVRCQTQQLPVCGAVDMSLTEGAHLEAVLGIHEEVASQIIEHDGVLLRVVLILTPHHPQGLHLAKKQRKKCQVSPDNTVTNEDFQFGFSRPIKKKFT